MGFITNLLQRWNPDPDAMSHDDEQLWFSAASRDDIGEYMALWLEGRILSIPGYCGPVDVDEDRVPGMAQLLADCCRAGLITHASQAAYIGTGYDRNLWRLRAAVEAFTTDAVLDQLTDIVTAAGLNIQAGRAGRFTSHRDAVDVTLCAGRAVTGFGAILSERHLSDEWVGYGICRPSAVADICTSWQVLVYDPEWGRNDRLWPALAEFAGA